MITAATIARAVSYHLTTSPVINLDGLIAAEEVERLSPEIEPEEELDDTKLPTVTVKVDGRTFHITVTEETSS